MAQLGRCWSGKRWFCVAELLPQAASDEVKKETGFAETEEGLSIWQWQGSAA